MFGRDSMLPLRNYKTVSVCLLILIVAAVSVAVPQKSASWYYPGGRDYEKGHLSELKDKRRVYVFSFFHNTVPQNFRSTGLRQRLLNLLSSYHGLQLVENPEEAELAIYISSFESVGAADYDFYVLTRGEQLKDGGYKPRVIVKKFRSDSKDSTALIEQAVNTFVEDLKAVRGEK